MKEKKFGETAIKLGRNPIGIIALSISLVYSLTCIVAISSKLEEYQNNILIGFIIGFPIFTMILFYRLVTKHHDKLYAPSDFNDENYFYKIIEKNIETSPKINQLETLTKKIHEEIYNQPLYRYTKLEEEGKKIVLQIFSKEKIEIKKYLEEYQLNSKIIEEQINIILEYNWIELDNNNNIIITEKGKNDIKTFQDICYGRLR